MKKYLMGTRNVKKQDCDLCGKNFRYRELRLVQTIDGDILVCSRCYSEIINNHHDWVVEDINVKNYAYDALNAVTDDEKVRDVGL